MSRMTGRITLRSRARALLVVATLANFWTEVLWYQSVDFSGVFTTQLVTKALLGLAGSLLFIFISSLGVVVIAQRLITRRVRESVKVLKDVEDGNLDARIDVSGVDELSSIQLGINSMTAKERTHPKIINGSRKRRIAVGSGTTVQELNQMLKQFAQVQTMMKKMKGGKGRRLMAQLAGKMGGMGGMPKM